MLPSGFLAHILPPSIDSCWLGFRGHASPRAIRSLPFSLRGLHPLAETRSPVLLGRSAACRSRDSCPTCLSFSFRPSAAVPGSAYLFLHLSDRSASLASPTSRPTMPYADFCPAVRQPCDHLSRHSDAGQFSWGKLSHFLCTVAESTLRALDGYGLRGKLPDRPALAPCIRFLSIDSHVCSMLPSDPASRQQPLHHH